MMTVKKDMGSITHVLARKLKMEIQNIEQEVNSPAFIAR
jgi:hypothetical protein